ncbi:hypothetical protein [Gordonia sihwensis]|uniref:hypothetical protein n=1 Tax=Gordonia TaxID=2053 RepID=UPI0024162824|nr:hypothetical protein [Gordonia sihwensis]WFN91992.1 hypothetical protein P5P27_14605 [Gordonia sihwensis]
MSSSDPIRRVSGVPSTLRWAGYVTAVQGALGLIVAVVLVIREMAGHHEAAISGYGTAAWFAAIGGGVFAGGLALTRGRRWGRGVSLMAQILLLPVAYTLITGSGLPLIGVPVAIVALAVLVLLFAPASLTWLNADDLPPDA